MESHAWAIVTGASAGIGEAYARHLASLGFNLILTARRASRLERLAADLPVQTQVVPADLTVPADRDRLWREVEARAEDASFLFNNAGFGLRGPFAGLDRSRQLEMIQLNVVALTDLSHRFVTLRQAKGGGGALVNNASVVGLKPVLDHAIYSATKAFVVAFSQILAREVRQDGIQVQALCPGPVPTEFQEVAGFQLDRRSQKVAISAEQVARESYQALGRGKIIHVPGTRLRLIMNLVRLLPPDLTGWLSAMADPRKPAQ